MEVEKVDGKNRLYSYFNLAFKLQNSFLRGEVFVDYLAIIFKSCTASLSILYWLAKKFVRVFVTEKPE